MRFLLALFFILVSYKVHARIDIPRQLSHRDRLQVLDVLGFSTSSKILADPYPLGGYAGFDIGIQTEIIPIQELSDVGAPSQNKDTYFYPIFAVGKGLYNNFDLFIHFIPFSQGTGISEYGGIVRWGFYQMSYAPISFSLLFSANSVNLSDQLILTNYGADFSIGLTAQNIYFYLGSGEAYTRGQFNGGSSGLTDSGNEEREKKRHLHYFFGLGAHIGFISLTSQMDYYTNPSYSLKLSYHF